MIVMAAIISIALISSPSTSSAAAWQNIARDAGRVTAKIDGSVTPQGVLQATLSITANGDMSGPYREMFQPLKERLEQISYTTALIRNRFVLSRDLPSNPNEASRCGGWGDMTKRAKPC
jgi:hypothetical protein